MRDEDDEQVVDDVLDDVEDEEDEDRMQLIMDDEEGDILGEVVLKHEYDTKVLCTLDIKQTEVVEYIVLQVEIAIFVVIIQYMNLHQTEHLQ